MSATTLHNVNDVVILTFNDAKITDANRIEMIGAELQAAMSSAIERKLLVDFRGVLFMSSAIITKLVVLHKNCKAKGIDLKFCAISPNVMEVFKITKLNKLFSIYDSEEKAIAKF